ncbi:MAG: amidohydrolase family protein [Actinomycetota bacterium]|nr:amidohydrolase family protein [Actinomycetota bacterium]
MLAIKAGRAFDGEQQMPGGVLALIDQGRIVGVEPAAAPLPEGWAVVEFPGATVLPGLIDTHVHLGGDSHDGALDRLPGYRDNELTDVIEAALRHHVAVGVTTVRDLGDRRWSVLEHRDRAAGSGGGVTAPTIVASGPPITSVRGHCWPMGGEAEGAAQLRAAIRERAERRVDVVKIMASGGVMTAGTDLLGCQFSLDDLRLIVDEAHAAGLPVTAHAHALPAVEQAVKAGVDGIEHCTCLTPSGVDAPEILLERLADSRIAVCPTLGRAAGLSPSPAYVQRMQRRGVTWEKLLEQVGRAHQAGVRLLAGTDGGIADSKPHGILPTAIADLVASGVSASEALASATSIAAQVCGLGTRKGGLRVGYDADLLVVDGDPFADIHALTQTAAVMVGGHWVDFAAVSSVDDLATATTG